MTRTLREATPGEVVEVKRITGEPRIRQRIVEMGITPGIKVRVERVATLGDPVEIKVRGYNLSLRKSEAERVEILTISSDQKRESE